MHEQFESSNILKGCGSALKGVFPGYSKECVLNNHTLSVFLITNDVLHVIRTILWIKNGRNWDIGSKYFRYGAIVSPNFCHSRISLAGINKTHNHSKMHLSCAA